MGKKTSHTTTKILVGKGSRGSALCQKTPQGAFLHWKEGKRGQRQRDLLGNRRRRDRALVNPEGGKNYGHQKKGDFASREPGQSREHVTGEEGKTGLESVNNNLSLQQKEKSE